MTFVIQYNIDLSRYVIISVSLLTPLLFKQTSRMPEIIGDPGTKIQILRQNVSDFGRSWSRSTNNYTPTSNANYRRCIKARSSRAVDIYQLICWVSNIRLSTETHTHTHARTHTRTHRNRHVCARNKAASMKLAFQ